MGKFNKIELVIQKNVNIISFTIFLVILTYQVLQCTVDTHQVLIRSPVAVPLPPLCFCSSVAQEVLTVAEAQHTDAGCSPGHPLHLQKGRAPQ